jgi:hypothetical protein
MGTWTSALDIINLLIADRVLPMEIGEVASDMEVMEEAVIDRRDSEEEVAVDVTMEESLSTELVDVWLLAPLWGSLGM